MATDADVLSPSISPASVRPNAEKVSALIKMPIPRDLKQVRALLGGVGHMSNRIRPITSLLRKGVKFEFAPAMEVIAPEILAEIAAPPILVSRPFHVYCDACIDGFGAALEKKSNRTGQYGPSLTSAALPSIPRGTGLRSTWKLAALSRPSNGFEATSGARRFRIISGHKALESIGKVGDHNA